jgi:hypothetical protein
MRIDRRDQELLRVIADHRVMTFKQLVWAAGRDIKTLQRRIGDLAAAGLIVQSDRKSRTGRGRPEKLSSASATGVALLRDAGILPQDVTDEDVTLAGLPHIEHQLLLNWVRVQWVRMERLHSALKIRFLSHSAPAFSRSKHDVEPEVQSAPLVIRLAEGDGLIPDAVAAIADVERGRTVLFFIEVDMGSEPFEATKKGRTSVVQKIQKYQRCFQAQGYREYERRWNCPLRGFRVLFVASTTARFASLSAGLDGVRPREFIWITDERSLLMHGVEGRIFARGGHQDRPLESILGSRADEILSAPAIAVEACRDP